MMLHIFSDFKRGKIRSYRPPAQNSLWIPGAFKVLVLVTPRCLTFGAQCDVAPAAPLPLCPSLSLELIVFPPGCLLFILSPGHAPPLFPGCPSAIPQVLPWPIPSHYSESRSDVTFSETPALAKVAQPSLVTHASHQPLFRFFFSILSTI